MQMALTDVNMNVITLSVVLTHALAPLAFP